MAKRQPLPHHKATFAGICAHNDRHFPVTITALTCDGCEASLARSDSDKWNAEDDFCALTIAGAIMINGRVVAHEGGSARIAFYGHIHPVVVARLTGARG